MRDQREGHSRHRVGRWIPHQDALEEWLEGLIGDLKVAGDGVTIRPVIQVPRGRNYSKRHLESVNQMLLLINEVIGRAPEYNETGPVGCPLNAVLDWCMGTPAGFAAFRNDAVNAMFRKVLRAWCEYLTAPIRSP